MNITDPKNIICFYHNKCVDGTTAAAVVLKKFPEAQTFPVAYESYEVDFAVALPSINSNTTVIFVDTTSGLEKIVPLAKNLLVIDHHISEKVHVETLVSENQNMEYVFDNEESGASLAYRYFFPSETVPTIIKYVKDIDLWNNEYLPESVESHIYLSTLRNRPELIKECFAEEKLPGYLEHGRILKNYADVDIEIMSQIPFVEVEIAGGPVILTNVTNHQAKVGNILSLKHGKTTVMYTIKGSITRFSIRSVDGCVPNAVEVATSYPEGGGHAHAAGATLKTADFLALLQTGLK